MPKVFKRFSLRKREAKHLLDKVSQNLKIDIKKMFGSKPQIEVVDILKNKIYLINGDPLFATFKDTFFPTLFFGKYMSQLPKVTIDMGAVPHICNGADIMAPGIVEVRGDFNEKALVVVIDDRNKRPIAVAQSLFSSEEIGTIKKGKVFKNLHYIGDEIWNLMKERVSK